MKRMGSNLDEYQEQQLLKIEHRGCWLAFWGLLAVIIAELFLFDFNPRILAGEWIVFMGLALYISIACLRRGIWDRRMKADPKTNLLMSLIAAVVLGGIVFAYSRLRFPDAPPLVSAISAGITALITFALCFLTLSLFARSYQKKLREQEEEPEEESDKE